MDSLPRIRAGLLCHPLDGQVLVYDPRDDRVHLLDPTTGCVVELLQEGGWTSDGITAELARRLNVAPDPAFLPLALEQLRAADLLDDTAPVPAPLLDVSRRQMVRDLAMTGAAALLIPAIATLTATTGYAQGSTLSGLGSSCGTDTDCISNRCCRETCAETACTGAFGPCAFDPSPFPANDCTCCSGTCLPDPPRCA